MAEIKELGESLLGRQQRRNDRQYDQSRREAYKIALATAGVGLVNEQLKVKATEFMASEPVLAQKAKYRAAVAQAKTIADMNEDIMATNQTPEEYFMNTRYLPQMEEQYKAQYGTQFVPESYLPLLREKASELARAEAETFSESLRVAQALPDYETAMSEINSVVLPPTSAGGGLLRKVKGLFSGRTEDDFRREALDKVEEQGLIRNESVREAFDKVNRLQGIDEAINFVKRLNTSGFKETQKVVVDTKIMADNSGGFGIFNTETTSDGDGNTISTRTTHERIEGLGDEEKKQKVIDAIIAQADIPNLARQTLNPRGAALLARRLNENGLNLVSVRTPEDFSKVSSIYQDITTNPENLKDDAVDAAIMAAVAEVLGATEGGLKAFMTEGERADVPLEQMVSEALSRFGGALDASKILGNPDVDQLNEQTVTTPFTVEWNNLQQ